ncbi:Holliday junction DNA helicase RuvA [candidate division WOR-1 bacterium RIFOXYA12_FULL_52_29]|uniref:Holliday junction branch migration complex subunit RuvA n=1 Tax=candidate division WOR-1 bacterium RIFOXYC12_FULL_54_18 TaxID=1802584 RepID=A0A1F4T7A7_UNCSA|nr:MAG: Holliday junction DNA helicase RuvA [candidate division WOR-1 bacterium RIFOXYA2_FULL_51_19]OGC18177.1 MAG: Holliday junction DNA helicase RuvA [candidate division WOR-1 bacterium RIFOXYA12_FULL_52_29]OGC27032.1 MAG: Holliday junction DNA helicase RuvA [candidate division WOR-1 bacterium RIFOXYB2_FULL_45_9]OGC28594.1 MAG: Holliday junction DNA helicase RuvA [candidate division WOR-1 bacterium RIFOXYC12_FULL_54_18]OGC30951.1 MAG: Holliday junction DNA helicase RuvA [candidate division WO
MISHLNGTLASVDLNSVVIEVGNIGYLVKVPAAVVSRLPAVGGPLKLFTIQIVREDDISLYGFISTEERSLFSLFLSVSGVGPKMAMAIISSFPLDKLVSAVAKGDVALLSSVSGVGKKTAERVVLELREKIAKKYAVTPQEMGTGIKGGESALGSDSISALISLGYSPKEAREAVMRVDLEQATSVEAVIKTALKNLL